MHLLPLATLRAAFCCCATFLLFACHGSDESSGPPALRRGLPGDPRSLDPQIADDTFSLQVLADTWEGLTNLDESGRVVAGAAEDWTVNASGTVYVFRLRQEAKWSDGQDVVAQQFVDGLQHAVDPKSGSGSAALLSIIKNASDVMAGKQPVASLGAQAINSKTIQIEVERPAPFILQILSEPVAAPMRASRDTSTSHVTNGPFTVKLHRPGSSLKLEINPYYWNKSKVHFKSVSYEITESESSELRQYQAGQLDLTYTLPISDLARIRTSQPTEIQSGPILGTMYLALNLANKELRDNPRVREALSIAIDREPIATNLTLGATPAFSFVGKSVFGYSPAIYEWSTSPRGEQLALAQALYAQAGFSPRHPLKIRLYYNSNESINRIMVAIADSWKRNLGVDTILLGEEFRVFLDGRKDKTKWDAARLGWLADYNDASSYLEIFSKSGSQNDPGYNSDRFNELINAARAEANEQKRSSILSEAEATLLNDYPIIPIYFYGAMHLTKPNIAGSSVNPENRVYSRLLSPR